MLWEIQFSMAESDTEKAIHEDCLFVISQFDSLKNRVQNDGVCLHLML